MTRATHIVQSNANPYETGIVTSHEHLGSSYVRFGTSFKFAIVLTGLLILAILLTRNGFKEIIRPTTGGEGPLVNNRG